MKLSVVMDAWTCSPLDAEVGGWLRAHGQPRLRAKTLLIINKSKYVNTPKRAMSIFFLYTPLGFDHSLWTLATALGKLRQTRVRASEIQFSESDSRTYSLNSSGTAG